MRYPVIQEDTITYHTIIETCVKAIAGLIVCAADLTFTMLVIVLFQQFLYTGTKIFFYTTNKIAKNLSRFEKLLWFMVIERCTPSSLTSFYFSVA